MNDWLVLSPAGYASGSDPLVQLGRWTMANKEVPAAVVWKVLHKPELATKSLRGEAATAPVLGK